jgi:hypothetical protein
MTQYCVQITLGHPFDVLDGDGRVVSQNRQRLLIPFDDYRSARAASQGMDITIVEKSDAFRPQIRGEVVRDAIEE